MSVARIRGRLLLPRSDRRAIDIIDDGLIDIDRHGRISTVSVAPADCTEPTTAPGTVWCPGFVDTHVHFPQTRVLGSAAGPLLDWLARTVFPEESRFVDRAYAEAVADEFCAELLRAGTTTAAIYSSSDASATDVLFGALERWGLRARAGLTLMDRGAPKVLCVPPEVALPANEALVERWHGRDDRLFVCITPRFALSCSAKMLRGAADLVERHGLWMQTHLSENPVEIEQTLAAFPGAKDYLSVYADHGLATERSLFAHCIHLADREWDGLADRGCAVAHCPDSNFFLGSGVMPLDQALRRGIPVGLGTDVGAGRTFSIPRIAASAYDAALISGSAQTAETLLWHATYGGAAALGFGERVGRIAAGYDADLVALTVPAHLGETPDALFDALVFRHDAPPPARVRVRGRPVTAAGAVSRP